MSQFDAFLLTTAILAGVPAAIAIIAWLFERWRNHHQKTEHGTS